METQDLGGEGCIKKKNQNITLVCHCFPAAQQQTAKEQVQYHMTDLCNTFNECHTPLSVTESICLTDSPRTLIGDSAIH